MLSALMTIGNWRYRSINYYYYSSAERCFMFFSHEEPTLETLDFAFYIGSFIGNVLYFDLYLNTAYAPCTCTMFGLFCSLLFTSQSDTKGSFGLKSGIYKHVIINKWIRLFNKYNLSDLHELPHSFLIFNVFFLLTYTSVNLLLGLSNVWKLWFFPSCTRKWSIIVWLWYWCKSAYFEV